MKIDLHIHTKTCSDGNLPIDEVFKEAKNRHIELISTTDHDSIDCQQKAISLAQGHGIAYVTGVELNVTFEYPIDDSTTKATSLDFLGYQYDINNRELKNKLLLMKERREARARQILDNLNTEFDKEGIEKFTEQDLKNIQDTVDGTFGRPHIANYLIEKGIVRDKQEAFDKYLVKCDVPKYPLSIAEASTLIRNAGGILVFAHPNDPNGTSLVTVTRDLDKQTKIIEEYMLDYIDGVECWHARHDKKTTAHYIAFAKKHGLVMTGGSDCHQKPIIMGTLDIPDWVAGQFEPDAKRKTSKFKGALV
ncbi:MAG TPA: PHP domain-containing protein [Dehalococcoidia bacterium]|nr:PHP domain-containing protein [Dehalococcoidia bacterium]